MGGFYHKRVFTILEYSDEPLSSQEVWDLFKLYYKDEMAKYMGKTKKSTIESVLSKSYRDRDVERVHTNGRYKYYLYRSNMNKMLTKILQDDEYEALTSLLTLSSDVC